MTRPIRIARVIARLNVGGPALHVSLLSANLPAEAFETRLFVGAVAPDEREMIEVLEPARIPLTRIPELGRAVRARDDAVALARLTNELRRYKPDIVHTHTAKAGALGRIAGLICRVPRLVHTFHGHVFEGYFSPVMSRTVITVERTLARLTDTVITISPRQYEDITERFRIVPAHKARVIPLGFDLTPFLNAGVHRGRLRAELGISSDVTIVACVGRLVPIKDCALLLRAFALVRSRAVLVLAGDGSERRTLEALARDLGIHERVYFLGFRTSLERLLADVRVVALSSKNEGTPVALIEGLAAGCIPVATSVGGVADVLENGKYGRLVDSRAPEDFARALDEVLNPSSPYSSGFSAEAGRRYVQKKYGLERLVLDHAKLYRDLLARNG